MNTTTTLTLNDRFSMFKSSNGIAPQQQRGRSGSQARSGSRGRGRQQQQQVDLRGSQRNRKLLDQLEKQHKMRMALKLKNKSILTSRGRAQGQIIRTGARRAANIKKAVNVRNLRRANSLTTFVPLNDGPRRNFRGRSRSRSQSRNRAQQQTGSITDRLGARPPQRRMRRGPSNGAQQQQQTQTQRSRSRPRSRVRLNRNNFNNQNNNNNRNGNSQVRNNGNNRNGNSQVRNNGNNRNGNSQVRTNGNNRNGNSQVRANSTRCANSVRRANPVNARLGNSGQSQIRRRNNVAAAVSGRRRGSAANNRNPNTQLKKPLTGRIVKRNARKPVGARVQRNASNAPGANVRRGKMVKRGNNAQPQAPRGRANARGGANSGQAGQGSRRGRSRTRRDGAQPNGNNKRGGAGGGFSKAALDKQLDDYMSKGSA